MDDTRYQNIPNLRIHDIRPLVHLLGDGNVFLVSIYSIEYGRANGFVFHYTWDMSENQI